MAQELETFWFERAGRGCRTVGWQGNLCVAVYALVVAAATELLIERTIVGFLAAIVLATAIFLKVATARTRVRVGR